MSAPSNGVAAAGPRAELQRRCDVIEESYEFFLAYAAQGLAGDGGSSSGGQLREFLRRSAAALTGLAGVFSAIVAQEQLEPAERYRAVIGVIERDAHDSLALIELVLAQPSISSQLVDNLNASIHLRALLTDLFVVDELLKTQRLASGAGSTP